jgi:hypothetical protein
VRYITIFLLASFRYNRGGHEELRHVQCHDTKSTLLGKCLPKYHDIKVHGGNGDTSSLILNFGAHCLGGWVDHSTGLEAVCPVEERTPVAQSVASNLATFKIVMNLRVL